MTFKTSMTKDEFYALRKSLGLDRAEAAKVLNVTVDTLRKWEGQKKGGIGPHPTAVIYLQVIKSFPLLIPPFWPGRLIEDQEEQYNGD